MGLSTTHLILLLLVVVILFGSNKISTLMGDVAKGIKSFKKGLEDEEADKKAISPPQSYEAKSGKEDTKSRERS